MENSREPQPQAEAEAEAEAEVRCPRCNSEKTKFCYYNNYSLTQPRYLCKSCRRYWTKGGTLRNVPPGGASRKPKPKRTRARNRAPKSQPPPPPPPETTLPAPGTPPPACEGTAGGASWGGEPPSLTSLLLTGGGGFGVDGFMAPPPLLGDISVLSAVPPVDCNWADIGGCAFP